jgi:hypothetical protein
MSKRRHKRYVRRLETEFSAEGKSYRGLSSDFSVTGIFIRTNHAFEPGTKMEMLVHLPDGSDTKLRGTVKRAMKIFAISLKNGMGIELTQSDMNYVTFMKSFTGVETEPIQPGPEMPSERNDSVSTDGSGLHPGLIMIQCPHCGEKNMIDRETPLSTARCEKCTGQLLMTRPEAPDNAGTQGLVVITCLKCGAKNKVSGARVASSRCGKCFAPLKMA